MINVKYTVTGHGDSWKVTKHWNPNYEDIDYNGDSTEKHWDLFSGTLSDCDAFLNLYKQGHIQ